MAKKKTTSAVVLTARQLLNGYTTDSDRKLLWNSAPYQMIPVEEKDDDWRMWNMDWLEYIGMQQINRESKNLKRNYDLANGVINKSDYMMTSENEFSEMIGIITNDTGSPFSLKYYPIIPNVIQVLTGEFAKREKRIIVKATDEYAYNEAMEFKKGLISDILSQDAVNKTVAQLQSQGIDIESEEAQQQINVAAELAQAEVKYKSYRGIGEQWGQHMVNSFQERYNMYEKEIEGFGDSLKGDREFWHIDIMDDDFNVELWNPINVFYHKSPEVPYISEGNYVGHISLMSIPDVIDMFGRYMNSKQLDQLKMAQSTVLRTSNAQEDIHKWDPTNYWDASIPYDKQPKNSIQFDQYMGLKNEAADLTGLNWNDLYKMETPNPGDETLIRVTRAYWKSQRRVGHLFKVTDAGDIIQEIVDECYKCTVEPVYDTSIVKNKTKDNLVYGEHIDWIWINEVWKGIKIGPNNVTYFQSKGFGFDPIYVNIEPMRFQFKGRESLYGGKLPVEGRIFSERNSVSQSLVSKMKPFQLGFNIVNNQVMDFLADEVGKIVLIDQNMIPRNSMEGSWGKYNFPRFYQVMKDFQIAPVDTSLQNTEAPGTSFQHFQQIDLSKTDQILARLNLAQYFKQQAFEVVGITPQRLGSIQASESATGVQQAVNNSYAQTEMYFEQHINFLMPRVYQMMLEAAQFLTAEKPESRITYLNRKEETEWFRIEGWRTLLSEYQIYATAKADVRALKEKLTNLAIENNTAGGSLAELAEMATGESPSEIIANLRKFDAKREAEVEAQRQHELELQQAQQQFLLDQREKELANDNYWKEREIQKDILIANIQAEQSPDTTGLDQQSIDLDRDKQINDRLVKQQEMQNAALIADKQLEVEREKLQVARENMKNDEKIARINATKRNTPKK